MVNHGPVGVSLKLKPFTSVLMLRFILDKHIEESIIAKAFFHRFTGYQKPVSAQQLLTWDTLSQIIRMAKPKTWRYNKTPSFWGQIDENGLFEKQNPPLKYNK